MSNLFKTVIGIVVGALLIVYGYLGGYAYGEKHGAQNERTNIILKCEDYGVVISENVLMQCKVQRPAKISQFS